ncbi:cupredoxin domain-containing protein [Natronobacterium texcoconense]|uniref:Cytochrome c oxidase subunit 2 n=1 Tax=Natronobacterium texcoconense TaxID=1095778 RepID=A0A1H1AVZ2_NATTX|nr:cytochrome C oxidase subunit II [Natronobacterium texcoconense]SDQ43840.1 cytochrome c oxidase subunit 2 [Natronobacterium texcoconense]
MTSPIKPPEGNWWDQPVNRRETIWLGLCTGWAFVLFGWMSAFTRVGDQNPIGESYKVESEEYREKVQAYIEEAEETDDGIVPPGDDVYIGAYSFSWDGLPVVLEAGREYNIHLGSYDVQHGFSIRPEETLSQQINLQMLPGYEWIVPMEFEEPGTYRVLCNEFCGNGHETMHGRLIVEEPE